MRGKPRGYNKKRVNRIRIKKPKPVKRVLTLEEQNLKNKIKEVNKRIDIIYKRYGNDKWAVKKLKSRLGIEELNGIDRKGYVKRVSYKDGFKVKAINKALDLFLKAKTSTLKGIRDTIKRSKQTIKELLIDEDEEDVDIDEEDVNTFYDFYIDDEFKWLINYIEPSELMVMIQEARANNVSENGFIKELKNYIDFGNDKDILERLKRLYNHLIVQERDF